MPLVDAPSRHLLVITNSMKGGRTQSESPNHFTTESLPGADKKSRHTCKHCAQLGPGRQAQGAVRVVAAQQVPSTNATEHLAICEGLSVVEQRKTAQVGSVDSCAWRCETQFCYAWQPFRSGWGQGGRKFQRSITNERYWENFTIHTFVQSGSGKSYHFCLDAIVGSTRFAIHSCGVCFLHFVRSLAEFCICALSAEVWLFSWHLASSLSNSNQAAHWHLFWGKCQPTDSGSWWIQNCSGTCSHCCRSHR